MSDWKQEIRRRLAGLSIEPTREAEIVEELAQHLEQRYAELRAKGAIDHEASRAALVSFTAPTSRLKASAASAVMATLAG